MANQPVTIVRVYLTEGEHLLSKVLKFLHDQDKVSGVTVLRGIAGFGPGGKMQTSSLVDLSLDLPLIIEFYDLPERAEAVIAHLQQQMGLTHVVSWPATAHTGSI